MLWNQDVEETTCQSRTGWMSVCLDKEFCWLELAQFNRWWEVGEFGIFGPRVLDPQILTTNFTMWHSTITPWTFSILYCCNGQEKGKKKPCFSKSFITDPSLLHFGLSSQEAARPPPATSSSPSGTILSASPEPLPAGARASGVFPLEQLLGPGSVEGIMH